MAMTATPKAKIATVKPSSTPARDAPSHRTKKMQMTKPPKSRAWFLALVGVASSVVNKLLVAWLTPAKYRSTKTFSSGLTHMMKAPRQSLRLASLLALVSDAPSAVHREDPGGPPRGEHERHHDGRRVEVQEEDREGRERLPGGHGRHASHEQADWEVRIPRRQQHHDRGDHRHRSVHHELSEELKSTFEPSAVEGIQEPHDHEVHQQHHAAQRVGHSAAKAAVSLVLSVRARLVEELLPKAHAGERQDAGQAHQRLVAV
eukprot:scaffold2733_cov255-Pinguiococcus_pyrenoidosus.AAC.4